MKENWCYRRIGWSSTAVCVEVVWTHGENGGLIGEEISRFGCVRSEVERKTKNGMDG